MSTVAELAGVCVIPYRPDPAQSNGNSPFTGEKAEARKKTLGASEIAAVAGLSPWGETALDVYLRKVGINPPFQGNEYTEWGNRLEDVIVQKYADALGYKVERCGTFVRDWMSATPDRIASANAPVSEGPEAMDYWGVEAKNRNARLAYMFGETGTDQVSDDIAAQCHWGMAVTTLPFWDVPVLLGGCEFRWFRLYRDESIETDLVQMGYDFWHNHVLKGIEPPVDGSESWTKHLQRKFAKHSDQLREATEPEVALIRELNEVRAIVDEVDGEKTRLENLIKNAIGESAGIMSPYGGFTWKAPAKGNPKWKEIAEALGANDHPDLIERHRGDVSRKFLAKEAK